MGFKDYRSLSEIAEIWAKDPRALGDRDCLHRHLVEAICDGAFFEDGLAIRAHALLRWMDPNGETYDSSRKGAEIQPDGSIKAVTGEQLPDFGVVYDQMALHGYLGSAASVPASAAEDPDTFFDWVKHTEPSSHGEAVQRLFGLVVINMRAFRNWCRASGRAVPGFVADWTDSRPFDPNHRGAVVLPDTDLISLCEAVTWLTTGRARPARVLKRLMDCHHGGRWPRGLWRELEADAGKLVAALRRGDLEAYGQVDGGPHAALPRKYFDSDVFAEFGNNTIGPDPQAFERGSYPEGLPTYRSVRFRRSQLWNAMRHMVRESKEGDRTGRTPTVAAGRRCFNWLLGVMRAGPQEAPKIAYQEQAIGKFGVSKRQFVQAWAQARQEVDSPEWGRAGPKPKRSDRLMDRPDGSAIDQ